MIKQVIFDWSGTLSDDESLTFDLTNQVLQHFGSKPVNRETYQREFQIPIENFYRKYIGNVPREEIDAVFFDLYQKSKHSSHLFDRVDDLLSLLKIRNMDVYLLSTIQSGLLTAVAEDQGIKPLVKNIYGGAADKRRVLPKLLMHENIQADETLYIGDTVHDIETAHASGVISGAAMYGYTDYDLLEAARPDYVFNRIDDIIDTLDKDYLRSHVKQVIPTVGGLIVNDDGQVLLNRTRKWGDRYGIPGGKIEYGECMEEAYFREIKEETGIHLENAMWITTQDSVESDEFCEPRHFILVNYLSRIHGAPPELKKNYEAYELGWFSVEQAFDMNLNLPTRKVLELASQRGMI